MAFTTLTQVNTSLPGQRSDWSKVTQTPTAGAWQSTWTVAGAPGQGVAPSSGVAGDIPTSATVGAFPFVNPSSGNTYLTRLESTAFITSTTAGLILALYDRLWHNSGISSTLTTAQTIQASSPVVPLTRPDANGENAEAWWEVYVVMGVGTPTVTLTYTDQSGNLGASANVTMATTLAVGRTGVFPLASGDTGVRSIQTWQANATFTSGTIGLVQRRLVTLIPLLGSARTFAIDAIGLGLPRIYDGACLELLVNCPSSTPWASPTTLHFGQG